MVISDDGFVLELHEGNDRAVLYFNDATASVEQVAEIVHAVFQQSTSDEPRGREYVGIDWI